MVPNPIHDVEELSASYSRAGKRASCLQSMSKPWTLFFLTLGCALSVFLAGFVVFAVSLNSKEGLPSQKADGIVALTGGTDRISDAVELLSSGYGTRLLITGVNLSTSVERLSKVTQRGGNFFACCIDIDYAARNTVENAIETRRWVEERNFKSIIVVTSNYHMPRAMIELQRALSDVKLIAHPIVSERPLSGEIFRRSLISVKVMATEYTKLVISYTRSLFSPKLTMTASTIPIVSPLPTGSLRKAAPAFDRVISINSGRETSLPN